MRILLCSLLAAGVFGCSMKEDEKPAVAEKNEGQEKKGQGGGAASLFLPIDGDQKPAGSGQSQPQPAPAIDPKAIFDVESRIVEWPKYGQENPNVVVADTDVEGWDPYSAAASAYVNIPARVEALTGEYNSRLQSQLDAIEGGKDPKPQTFQQFVKEFPKSGGKFKHQRPYRLYGYNPQTGKVVILEDKAMKKRIYEEKGIPWDE
jgi:hypothetical protein